MSPELVFWEVFAVTATFSVLAYVWLIVICMLWTPDVALACWVMQLIF